MKKTILFLLVIFFYQCQKNIQQNPSQNRRISNGGLILPKGFKASVLVDSIGPSRHLAVNVNGDVYVKLSIENGTKGNVALRDENGDGIADIVKRFGNYPNDGRFATEMRIHKGYLYYSSELVVYRQKLIEGQLIPEGEPEVIMIDEFPIRWHNSKSLAFDDLGGMYVTFSAPTNVCEDQSITYTDATSVVKGEYPCSQLDILGGIWKFDEATPNQKQADGELFATGLRSIVALSWNMQDNQLYALNHGRDYLHNHAPLHYSEWDNSVLPAEEFLIIKEGKNYGWPYTYYDPFKQKRMLAPEYGGDGSRESEEGYENPIMALPAHWAPNDLLFYKGDQFPAHYKKGAFVAFHGSTNRGPYPQAGYIVAFIPFENGKPFGRWEVFADGFSEQEIIINMKDATYRPMGLSEGPEGSLYISDSKKGKIWKVSFQGDPSSFGIKDRLVVERRKAMSHLRTPNIQKDFIPVN